MSVNLVLLVLLPLVVGSALAVSGRRADRVAAPIAIVTAAVATVLAVVLAVQRPTWEVPFLEGLPFRLAVDGLAAVFVVTVTAVTLAVLVFAHGDLGRDEARAMFFGLMTLFAGAMLVTVTAASLLPLLMAWEVMGATSYALIGYWWREERRASAATVAFVTTRAGDLGFYLAVAAAYAGAESLDIARLVDLPSPYLHVVAGGLLLAAAGKSAQLPFAFWLSRAMEGPSPVSALLHSATMVAAGAFLLLRVEPMLAATGWALPVAAVVGLVTALLLGLVAVWQQDVKQLLAASTSAQMGFVFVAAGSGSVAAGTTHLVTHAATKSLLFLAAGAWLTVLGTKQLVELRGAGRRMRAVGVPFALGALSLAGVPPLAMWVSKEEILTASLSASALLWVAALVAGALSAGYAGLMLGTGFARGEGENARAGWPTVVALSGLAVGTVLLAGLGLPDVSEQLGRAVGEIAEASVAWWSVTAASLLAVVIVLLVAHRAMRGWLPATRTTWHAWLAGWLDLERAARTVVVRPVDRLANLLAWFDDRILDGAVNGIARLLIRASDRTQGLFEEPVVDGAVESLATVARAVGRLARRPQTGMLHQYYAQAIIVIVALLLVALIVR